MTEDERYDMSLLEDRIAALEEKLTEVEDDTFGRIYDRLIALETALDKLLTPQPPTEGDTQ